MIKLLPYFLAYHHIYGSKEAFRNKTIVFIFFPVNLPRNVKCLILYLRSRQYHFLIRNSSIKTVFLDLSTLAAAISKSAVTFEAFFWVWGGGRGVSVF